MANGIRTGDPRGFNKGRSSKFREGSWVRQTPEEGRRTYRPKRCGNNNKDEDNSLKNLNDKNCLAHIWISCMRNYYTLMFSDKCFHLGCYNNYNIYGHCTLWYWNSDKINQIDKDPNSWHNTQRKMVKKALWGTCWTVLYFCTNAKIWS